LAKPSSNYVYWLLAIIAAFFSLSHEFSKAFRFHNQNKLVLRRQRAASRKVVRNEVINKYRKLKINCRDLRIYGDKSYKRKKYFDPF